MKETLLIAEGDSELRDLFEMSLGKYGYVVETASDGLDCLRTLRRVQPAVLVLDQQLRWGGGDGVLAYLREEGLNTPVILTTTAGCPRDVDDFVEPPVVTYLPKPFEVTALLESIRAAAAKKTSNLHRVAAYSELFIG